MCPLHWDGTTGCFLGSRGSGPKLIISSNARIKYILLWGSFSLKPSHSPPKGGAGSYFVALTRIELVTLYYLGNCEAGLSGDQGYFHLCSQSIVYATQFQ